jgi:hypothetical protein
VEIAAYAIGLDSSHVETDPRMRSRRCIHPSAQ